MTKQDFLFICNENLINPNVALEDNGVIEILKKNGGVQQQLLLNTYLQKNF